MFCLFVWNKEELLHVKKTGAKTFGNLLLYKLFLYLFVCSNRILLLWAGVYFSVAVKDYRINQGL